MIRKIYAHIINMHQGKLLKDEVRRRGLSDVKFAEMCGVSRQTVSVWYGRYDLSVKSKFQCKTGIPLRATINNLKPATQAGFVVL